MKKFFLLLAALFFVGGRAFATPSADITPAYIHGHITEINDYYVTVSDENQNAVRLVINWDTQILSGNSGREVTFSRLHKGDELSAYYSPAMTKSIPAQANAYALVMTPANDNNGMYAVVTNVEKTANGVRFLDKLTNNYVTIPKSVSASLQNIKAGDTVLVWYKVVALSSPGQANAQKAVLIEE